MSEHWLDKKLGEIVEQTDEDNDLSFESFGLEHSL